MDLEQLRATCEARVEELRLPHRFSTRDLRDAVAEQRGRPIILRPLSTLGAMDAPCGIRLETPDADLLFYEEGTSPLHHAGTPEGDAEVEAAVIAAAVNAKRAGLPLDGEEAPPAAGTRSRKGDLPAETTWLLLVADASARHPAPENAGAAS
ncbi:hypothetical protein OG625_03410 [Streptomyces sp. NBC_01351]|uniref:DUF6545 domain-containing protein n=1 Tax=Streptomyces sp. NBC_01351 TaxID=2903833 RepID=UPI002E3479CE|nr:DUF6545 domain-containing protein [Streptomyces sp. NBC_01351]